MIPTIGLGTLADRVTVVIVTFNSASVLKSCLEAIPAGMPVIVVDNASADIATVRRLVVRRGVRLVENTSNIGYGAACNRGAEVASTDYILFINPDVILTADALKNLLEVAEREPSYVAFNPHMITCGRRAMKRRSILLPRSQFLRRMEPDGDQEIPVLSGAAIFVKRRDFEAVGGFDSKIVLYHEDDDLSLRLRRERGPLMYVHNAVIEHLGGSSTRRSAEIQSLKSYEMGKSRVLVTRKHGFRNVAVSALASALVQIMNPINLLSARKRVKPGAYLRGVLAGLRVGSGN